MILILSATFSEGLFDEAETICLTLFRMAIFEAAHGWGGGRGCQKKSPPSPKKVQKIYESRDTPLEFC